MKERTRFRGFVAVFAIVVAAVFGVLMPASSALAGGWGSWSGIGAGGVFATWTGQLGQTFNTSTSGEFTTSSRVRADGGFRIGGILVDLTTGGLTFTASASPIFNNTGTTATTVEFRAKTGNSASTASYDFETGTTTNQRFYGTGLTATTAPQTCDCGTAGTPNTVTCDVQSNVVYLTDGDADACTVTLSETTAAAINADVGPIVIKVVSLGGGGTFTIADSAGVVELAGGVSWPGDSVGDTLTLEYNASGAVDAWNELARANN